MDATLGVYQLETWFIGFTFAGLSGGVCLRGYLFMFFLCLARLFFLYKTRLGYLNTMWLFPSQLIGVPQVVQL